MAEKTDLCDEELVRQFEAEARVRGLLSDQEIARESSQMIGRLLERKLQREGNREVLLASGRVKRMPGCGNVSAADSSIWRRLEEE